MTEAEAKTTRCGGPDGCGRLTGIQELKTPTGTYVLLERTCIGPACMSLRTRLGGQPENGIYQREVWCGLAGVPEQ